MGNLNFDFLDEMEAKEKEREDLLNLEGELAFAEAGGSNEGKVTLTPRQIKLQAARRFAMIGKEDNLAEILTKLDPPGLPEQGEEIHIIANVFDFWTVVPIILRKHRRIEELYISTWAIAMPQARDIVERIQTGQIGHVFLTCGTYMKRREPVVFSYLYENLVRSGGGGKMFRDARQGHNGGGRKRVLLDRRKRQPDEQPASRTDLNLQRRSPSRVPQKVDYRRAPI